MAVALYGVGLHKAAVSGDLKKMKAMEKKAEAFLAKHGNVAAALELLRLEIAKAEAAKKRKR